MRTLDEVIEGFERCHGTYGTDESCEYCPLFDICEHDPQMASPWDDDMYHYLKEYRDYQLGIIKLGNDMEEAISKEFDDNPALTWDELKQMEGKPVWVEDNIDESEDPTKYWAIYRRIEKAQETEYALLCDLYYDKAEYGKSWQAYRKERK